MNTLKYWRWLFALGLLALMDGIYISFHHFIPGPPPPYAFSMGIPNAPLGVMIYALIMFLIWQFMKTGKKWIFYTLMALLASQCLSGVSVFYDQTFVLGFFCALAYFYVLLSISMFFLFAYIWAVAGDSRPA
ncbi:hypothetical protein hrd7_12070 [Leptolinea sp. HRD-7]|nr:hypothetical protein hrd7_12070 [Leptolinea sp. HRD-7]